MEDFEQAGIAQTGLSQAKKEGAATWGFFLEENWKSNNKIIKKPHTRKWDWESGEARL